MQDEVELLQKHVRLLQQHSNMDTVLAGLESRASSAKWVAARRLGPSSPLASIIVRLQRELIKHPDTKVGLT